MTEESRGSRRRIIGISAAVAGAAAAAAAGVFGYRALKHRRHPHGTTEVAEHARVPESPIV